MSKPTVLKLFCAHTAIRSITDNIASTFQPVTTDVTLSGTPDDRHMVVHMADNTSVTFRASTQSGFVAEHISDLIALYAQYRLDNAKLYQKIIRQISLFNCVVSATFNRTDDSDRTDFIVGSVFEVAQAVNGFVCLPSGSMRDGDGKCLIGPDGSDYDDSFEPVGLARSSNPAPVSPKPAMHKPETADIDKVRQLVAAIHVPSARQHADAPSSHNDPIHAAMPEPPVLDSPTTETVSTSESAANPVPAADTVQHSNAPAQLTTTGLDSPPNASDSTSASVASATPAADIAQQPYAPARPATPALDSPLYETLSAPEPAANPTPAEQRQPVFSDAGFTLSIDADTTANTQVFKPVKTDAPAFDTQTDDPAAPIDIDTVRRMKSIAVLKLRGIPYSEQLNGIVLAHTKQRTVPEIAGRAIALLAVSVVAESLSSGDSYLEASHYANVLEERFGIYANLSPLENAFLENEHSSDVQRVQMSWRYECCAVMLWALGYIDLPYPSTICDVAEITKIILNQPNLDMFIKNSNPLSFETILDQADLTLRYNWACVNAKFNKKDPPAKLDSGVVVERQQALNWLVGAYNNAAWDDVGLT